MLVFAHLYRRCELYVGMATDRRIARAYLECVVIVLKELAIWRNDCSQESNSLMLGGRD